MNRRRVLTLILLVATLAVGCIMMLLSKLSTSFPESDEDFEAFLAGVAAGLIGSLVVALFLRYYGFPECDWVTLLLGVVLGLLAAGVVGCLWRIIDIMKAQQRYTQVGSELQSLGKSVG